MPHVSLASHATTRRHESCTDPPARVTNNRRDQAIRPPYYGDHFFSRPRCSYLMLGGASRHDRRVGHAATRWDVQTATRADSIRRWGKPPRGPTQFIWPVVARHDLDQFLPLISAIMSESGPSCSPYMTAWGVSVFAEPSLGLHVLHVGFTSEVGYGRVGELALLTLTGDSSFPRGPARSRLVRTSHPKFARERSQAAQRGPMHALTARRQLCAWPSNDSYESPTPSSKPSAQPGDCVMAAKINRWRHDSKINRWRHDCLCVVASGDPGQVVPPPHQFQWFRGVIGHDHRLGV